MSKEYVSREFDSRRISVIVHSSASDKLHSFFYKIVVFPAQAEYSYFSADFRLKIFLYYS